MKKLIALALLAVMIPSWCLAQDEKKEEKSEPAFTPVVENAITSVKDQHRSGTCWAYSSLGFFESELLRMGKGEYDLCESFLCYHTYLDRADAAVRTHGDVSFSEGGSFYDAVYCLKHYGIVPQSAMPGPGELYGDSLFNFTQLQKVTGAVVSTIAKGNFKSINPVWKKDLSSIYEHYFGELPEKFEYKGKTYTPQTFAASLGINTDDYISLTSYTHHPFYEPFVIEIQDNWRWGLSYNLPLDELMQTMDYAVRNGFTFAWGADVSEKGFDRSTGTATVPDDKPVESKEGSDAARWTGDNGKGGTDAKPSTKEKEITQEMRQLGYDNWETTDDHGMVIYGIAKDANGKEYFMMKNSWGTYGLYGGCWYVSYPFVAYKTMNILVHKDGIPKDIRKKLGIK
ncbi:MAG: aminopeptidase [Bacteroidaceae bacterium]|nr:aminopeptidase [Bacteroidaceae bacterium]